MLADGEFQYYVVEHAFNPELRQPRQADLRSRPGLHSAFQAIQSYTERPCFNKTDADVGNERPRQRNIMCSRIGESKRGGTAQVMKRTQVSATHPLPAGVLQTGEKTGEQLMLWPKEGLPGGASAGLSSSTQSAEAG